MADRDRNYDDYYRKWKDRLGLSDRHIGEGYMRGEALEATGFDFLPEDPSRTGLHVRVDGRGLDGAVDHGAIPDMLSDWRRFIEFQDTPNPRDLTKDLICGTVAMNRHLDGDNGSMILSAALWLASATPGILDAIVERGAGLLVEFTYEDGKRRMQASVMGE